MANESKYAKQIHRLRAGPRPPSSIWPRTVYKTDGTSQRHYFPFLDLPRELRDLIYEYALVAKDGIHIHAVRVAAPSLERFHRWLPISRTLVQHRTVHNYFQRLRRFPRGPRHAPSQVIYSPRKLTYESDFAQDLNVQIFSVSRQIYEEASRIFYGGNTFDFGSQSNDKELSLVTCYLFLTDRPALALAHL
ncbi:hypothetical protein BU16DRAFT_554867 [Lophium mytilinum]|uniref:F-box domain-containing protein n=1 Tax=Lophium mytilinum TaxID=390894 RepID=A0A6A6REF8_9PEZI|nr:hypothetical protein BU16DRAFT_554867 [Lophium mytilinum]